MQSVNVNLGSNRSLLRTSVKFCQQLDIYKVNHFGYGGGKKNTKGLIFVEIQNGRKKFQAKSVICVTWVCNVSNGIKVA